MSDHPETGRPIYETPTGLQFRRLAGGHNIHLVPRGSINALCGVEPSGGRGRWHDYNNGRNNQYRYCPDANTWVPYTPWCDKCQIKRAGWEQQKCT